MPSYYLSALDATVYLDLALKTATESRTLEKGDKNDGAQFGVGAFIGRSLGKGSIRTGVAFWLPPSVNGKTKNQTGGLITIPVIMEYAF
jgi:hypothetical protein